MASIKLRPTGSTGSNWSNMTNAHDGNESTCASVSVSRLNYYSRYMTLNFDTSVIPSGATINSATLTLRSKAGKNTITANVDINGDSQQRVINQKQSTTITNYTANVASYISDLQNIEVTAYDSNYSENTFELYELWIDVDYTASTTSTTYTITASSNVGGSISPDRETVVPENGSKSYRISANIGYGIKDVLIDGVSQGAITSYTFTNINSDHTIEVVFEPVPTVVAAIEKNKMHAIGLIEGESNMSLDINGLHVVKVYEDLAEDESIYLDENGVLHVYEFLLDLVDSEYEIKYIDNNEELITNGIDFAYAEANESVVISNINTTYDTNNENLIIGDNNGKFNNFRSFK